MLSKLMSYILRHNPSSINLTLDDEGWASLKDLVRNIKQFWPWKDLYQWVAEEHIKAIVLLDPKGRFEIRDNQYIRAAYGHSKSLEIKIKYRLDTGSKALYHGTIKERLGNILKLGLRPMERAFVHLSISVKDAYRTALRHGKEPVILRIDCECLRKKGINIYIASKYVRLAKYVPSDCIDILKE